MHDFYLTGPTPHIASARDPRFSYLMYVPERREGDPARYPLIVVQHGTGRTAEVYRDAFAPFAEKHRAVVLAPLFPAGIDDPDDLHNFKFIEYHGIRFDLLLLEMIEEAARRVPLHTEKFLLHGFSGGGQFTHRFLYLHPERLHAASVGAPGRMTLLDGTTRWWLGTADLEDRFGIKADPARIAQVSLQLVVGELDTEGWEINNPGDSNWLPGLEEQGATRIERLRTLQRNWAEHGITARLDLVPGVGHEGDRVLGPVMEFFGETLASLSE